MDNQWLCPVFGTLSTGPDSLTYDGQGMRNANLCAFLTFYKFKVKWSKSIFPLTYPLKTPGANLRIPNKGQSHGHHVDILVLSSLRTAPTPKFSFLAPSQRKLYKARVVKIEKHSLKQVAILWWYLPTFRRLTALSDTTNLLSQPLAKWFWWYAEDTFSRTH